MEEEKRALETTHRETADGATKERAELERALDALRRKEAELAAARDAADAEALQEKKAREALEGALREVTNTSRARDVELERERAAREKLEVDLREMTASARHDASELSAFQARFVLLTPVPVRSRSRGARRSSRTSPACACFSPPTIPRFQSRHTYATPFDPASDAFELRPDVASRGPSTTLSGNCGRRSARSRSSSACAKKRTRRRRRGARASSDRAARARRSRASFASCSCLRARRGTLRREPRRAKPSVGAAPSKRRRSGSRRSRRSSRRCRRAAAARARRAGRWSRG